MGFCCFLVFWQRFVVGKHLAAGNMCTTRTRRPRFTILCAVSASDRFVSGKIRQDDI